MAPRWGCARHKSLDREIQSPVAGDERQEQQNGMELESSTALNRPKRGVFLGLRGVLELRRASTLLCAARLEGVEAPVSSGCEPGVTV
jgi:hypothetical protein